VKSNLEGNYNQELKKIQHYVPKFYLKKFANEKSKNQFFIYCLFKQFDNKIVPNNIDNVAAEKFFYDKYPPQSIENYLSIAETDLSKTYNKIVCRKRIHRLTKKDNINLIYLIYFQYVRTDYMRTKTLQTLTYELDQKKNDIIKKNGIVLYNRLKNYVETEHYRILQNLLIRIDDEYVRKKSRNFNPNINPNILNLMLKLKKRMINHLKSLDKFLLEIRDSNYEFYTSDHPILFYNKYTQIKDDGLTFINIFDMKTQIYYPLNPKLCILLYKKEIYNFNEIYSKKKRFLAEKDFNLIKLINILITHESKRVIFSKKEDFKIALDYLKKNPHVRDKDLRRFIKDV